MIRSLYKRDGAAPSAAPPACVRAQHGQRGSRPSGGRAPAHGRRGARDGGVQTQTLQAASTDALREAVVHIDSAQSFAAQARVVHTQDDAMPSQT